MQKPLNVLALLRTKLKSALRSIPPSLTRCQTVNSGWLNGVLAVTFRLIRLSGQ